MVDLSALNRLGFPCSHMQEVILKLKRLPEVKSTSAGQPLLNSWNQLQVIA